MCFRLPHCSVLRWRQVNPRHSRGNSGAVRSAVAVHPAAAAPARVVRRPDASREAFAARSALAAHRALAAAPAACRALRGSPALRGAPTGRPRLGGAEFRPAPPPRRTRRVAQPGRVTGSAARPTTPPPRARSSSGSERGAGRSSRARGRRARRGTGGGQSAPSAHT